jgi:hypothetical protein
MPFTLPEDYITTIMSGRNAGQPKKESTKSIYRSRLNQIKSITGVSNRDEIINNPSRVIRTIKSIPRNEDESEESHKARLRTYFSSIFMVLPPSVRASPNPYWRANKGLQDTY